jgi:hypothetical protein
MYVCIYLFNFKKHTINVRGHVYTNSILTNKVIYSKSNLFSNAGISNKDLSLFVFIF